MALPNRGVTMKFLMIMYMNAGAWEQLTEEEQKEIQEGHGALMETMTKSGEMILTQALAHPSQSSVVRKVDGQPAVTDGPFIEAKEHFGGFYLIDVEDRERALELARLVPDTRFDGFGVEVRQVMFENGQLEP
jgi:hypothetical protein